MLKNRDMKLRAVSLFSGCGGLDWGFHQNGFEILTAIDNDPAAIKCYNYNFGGGGICVNVEDPIFKDIINEIGNVDIVLGGFPCQGFSKSGPKRKEDPRNNLYLSMLFAIKVLRPKVFVAENVDGLAQNYKGEVLTQILNDFSSIGYHVEYKIIDTADFGIPQHRRRIIFIGTSSEIKFSWPAPTHLAKVRNGEFLSKDLLKAEIGLFGSLLPKPITIRQAIGDLVNHVLGIDDHVTVNSIRQADFEIIKRIKEGQKLCNVRFSSSSVYTWEIPEVFGNVSQKEVIILEIIAKNRRKKVYGNIPNGNPLPLEEIERLANLKISIDEIHLLKAKGYIKEVNGKYDIKGAMFCSGLYKRPLWDEPAPTIITLFHNPRYLVHPSENRPLTVRECARLQSFPDSFMFLASGITIEESYRLIGNAVAPKLSFEIAKKIVDLFKTKCDYETTSGIEGKRGLAERV